MYSHWKKLRCMDYRNFNFIYGSLLLEGKAGNLTDLMVGMVLAEKLPTCLLVMHGRLKHLFISSEVFHEKRRLNTMLKLKQNKPVKEREWENTPKELGIWGLVEKGKGKGTRPHRKSIKTGIAPPNARKTSRNNQAPSLITGI